MPLPGDFIIPTEIYNRQAYTPTWNSVTVGTGAISEGWYAEIFGDMIVGGARLQFGTSPSVSTIVYLSLPVAAWTGGGTQLQMTLGSWTFRDTSASDHYSGSIGIYSSAGTSVSFNAAWNGTSPSRRITTGAPVTVAVDDVLSCQFMYLKQ